MLQEREINCVRRWFPLRKCAMMHVHNFQLVANDYVIVKFCDKNCRKMKMNTKNKPAISRLSH